MDDDRARSGLNAWSLVGIGSFLTGCLLAGMALGWFVDDRVHTTPLFILVGLVCGTGAGVAGAWIRIRPFLRDDGPAR